MIVRPWETDTDEAVSEVDPARTGPRLREQTSPIGQILGQNLLDAAVREIQQDLANLQAEQGRSIESLSGTLNQIAQELTSVRDQLTALREDAPADQRTALPAVNEARPLELDQTNERVERLERQLGLVLRGVDSFDALRAQAEVHTRAIGRLTEIVADTEPRLDLLRDDAAETASELRRATAGLDRRLDSAEQGQHGFELALSALERRERRTEGARRLAYALLTLGLTPGLAAAVWLVLQLLGVAPRDLLSGLLP